MAAAQPATSPQTLTSGESKSTASYIAALGDYLKQYVPPYSTPAQDTLSDRWRIDLSKPLPEYDTKTAQAYVATDLMQQERACFALVCKPGTYQRHHIISKLTALKHPNILPLVASGAVLLSQPAEERFVIFYERPIGRKISELVAETQGRLNEVFIIKEIIGPILSAIHQLSELGFSHGRINPDNIFYHQSPVLGDCVSEPCGYSQPFMYEPIERMQALPAAKGEGSSTQDYYAMAILVLYLQYGPAHFVGWTQDALIRSLLSNGVYNTLMRDKETSDRFEEFFRGMFVQYTADAWDHHYLKLWLDGKRFNVLHPSPPSEATRPFEFANWEALTRREIAHLLYVHWSSIPEILASGQLHQWLQVSLRNKEMMDNVARITQNVEEIGAKNIVQINEQLMHLLLFFDALGPIRIKPLAMHLDGMDSLYTELFITKSDAELQLMAKFIEFNMANFWLDLHKKKEGYVPPASINNILTRLEKLRICIRNTGMGFGLERVLYELNPHMPCQSPLLLHHYAGDLKSLLLHLDRMAQKLANTQDPMDRHVAAFVAGKLNMQYEIRLHELSNMPELANHPSIMALKLLSMAQYRVSSMALPGLSRWLGMRILPALERLRSRSLRTKLIAILMQRMETGSLPYMAEVIIDSNYAVADQDGYKRATYTFHANTQAIAGLRRGDGLDEKSSRLGYGIAKILASAAFVMTLLGVLKAAEL